MCLEAKPWTKLNRSKTTLKVLRGRTAILYEGDSAAALRGTGGVYPRRLLGRRCCRARVKVLLGAPPELSAHKISVEPGKWIALGNQPTAQVHRRTTRRGQELGRATTKRTVAVRPRCGQGLGALRRGDLVTIISFRVVELMVIQALHSLAVWVAPGGWKIHNMYMATAIRQVRWQEPAAFPAFTHPRTHRHGTHAHSSPIDSRPSQGHLPIT